ncbi:hypothetical protein AMOR_25380 [Anaeromyxobacter oryzae]|uniref:DUF304 domain-containing protein n=1 Tax=Anaeromyxobacter oryzae TaxID=2918170 RepID=A0ABN6MRC6_9BACT|nr:hypothetical protein AMOR_25380 [Anaeromyxobacter oryzae]
MSRAYGPTQLGGRIPAEISKELGGGEQLIWSGAPVGGLRLRSSDAVVVPFSLLWAGFALFWERAVLQDGAPLFFALWGVPFVLMGAYITVGRFFFDAWRRSRTVYAVTNERVLILSGGFRKAVTSLRLDTLPGISLREARSGIGTISFGGGTPTGSILGGLEGWPGAERHLGPRFDLVPNARSIYEAIQAGGEAIVAVRPLVNAAASARSEERRGPTRQSGRPSSRGRDWTGYALRAAAAGVASSASPTAASSLPESKGFSTIRIRSSRVPSRETYSSV